MASLELAGVELSVLLSPHGPRSGVYHTALGSLADFGIPGVSVERDGDRAAATQLAEDWGKPMLDDRVDHGAVVPLALIATGPVVVASLGDYTGPRAAAADAAIADAAAFAAAVRSLARSRNIAFIASANLAAGLSPRAPLTELPEAAALEREVVEACATDVARLADLAPALAAQGGSCAAGPLVALAHLFAGTAAAVLAHESPFGVGYLVAHLERRA